MSRVFLTNAGSVIAARRGVAKPETAASVGPGPVYSIMRFPRPQYGEAGEGRVIAFVPTSEELQAAKSGGEPAWPAYEAAIRERWRKGGARHWGPGALAVYVEHRDGAQWDGATWRAHGVVPDGATLICACGREQAAAGRCHRVIAAEYLAAAGWSVVLDGRLL